MSISIDLSCLTEPLQKRTSDLLGEARAELHKIADGSCIGSEWVGWYDYPRQGGIKLEAEIAEQVAKIDVEYDTVVVVGIGGSYLGTRAIADALSHEYFENAPHKKIVYAGNHLSAAGMTELLQFLEKRQPIINIISKSGTTTEPAVAFRILKNFLKKKYGPEEMSQRIIATTDPEKGALKELATNENYKCFEVPSDIGGRFSVLSAVGLVPLKLAGFDTAALMKGANHFFSQDIQSMTHPVIHYAAARKASFEAGKAIEFLAYADPKFNMVVEWWKQLFGESEGKDGQGLLPAGLMYTTDLHSLGQLVQDGARNMIETFLHIRESAAPLAVPEDEGNLDQLNYIAGMDIEEINHRAMLATKLAHFDGGVPCITLGLERLDEYHLGELLAFFETACGVSAALLGVHPYIQPGVEDYKKNLFALLGKPGYEELGATLVARTDSGTPK